MDDYELSRLLKRYDPVSEPPQSSLSSLEADILARVETSTFHDTYRGSLDGILATGFLHKNWTIRAAAIAAILIVAVGFFVGQYSGNEDTVSASVGTPTLLAFADDPILQSIPNADSSWGDKNNDAE